MNEHIAEELRIHAKNIADLSIDPANQRHHDERNLESIKGSLRRFGQQSPIIIDAKNVVRKGNGTLVAAKALGWTTIAAVQTSLAGSEATAYAIADNRTGELSKWEETLPEQLASLDEELRAAAGFTAEEFERLTTTPPGSGVSVEISNSFQVIAECASEADQKTLYERLMKEGFKCKALTM